MTQPSAPTPGPQASDPTVLPGGQVLPRQTPAPLPAGGAFRVDLERAPRAIADLETALDQLKELRLQALRLGQVAPAASDQVSIDAAEMLGRSATAGQGSLLAALDGGIAEVDALIDQLQADLRDYRTAEDRSAASLRDRT